MKKRKNLILFILILLSIFLLILFFLNNNSPQITTDYEFDGQIDLEKLNNYLKENEYYWQAGDSNYSRLINLMTPEERETLNSQILNLPVEITGVDIFEDVIDETNYEEYLEDTEITKQSPITGNIVVAKILKPKTLSFKDKILLTPPSPIKSQGGCGACVAFATIGAIETQLYYKYNKKYHFSEQYLFSYLNNKGCGGSKLAGYAKQLTNNPKSNAQFTTIDEKKISTLKTTNPELERNLNYLSQNSIDWRTYFLNRQIIDATQKSKLSVGNKIKMINHVNQTLKIGHPPIGMVSDYVVNLTTDRYDACEVIRLSEKNSKTTEAGMSISDYKLLGLFPAQAFSNFCPDDADVSSKLYNLKKLNPKSKLYFMGDYKTINSRAFCSLSHKKIIIDLIKSRLNNNTPVLVGIRTTKSLYAYKSGIWEPTKKENIQSLSPPNHAVYVVGYGTENLTKKEYWIIANSWGDDWGENGLFRIWIGEKNNLFECNSTPVFFTGELIEQPLEDYYILNETYENMLKDFEKPSYYKESQEILDSMASLQKIRNLSAIKNAKTIPDYIKEGNCINQDKTGKTGSSNYYSDNLNRLIGTWDNITYSDCDYGRHYCDQDQLHSAISQKLNLTDVIELGNMRFKKFCKNGVCSGIEATPGINLEISNANLTDINYFINNNTEALFNLPDYLKKYVIITITINGTQSLEVFDIPNYRYQINQKTHYQFRLDQYQNEEEKIISKFSENYTISAYFGAPINKSIIIITDFGDLESKENKDIFSNSYFLEGAWELYFKGENNNYSPGIYEIEILEINSQKKSANFNLRKLGDVFVRYALTSQSINPISHDYFGFKIYDSKSSNKINVVEISEYLDFEKINLGQILSFNLGTYNISNITLSDTLPIQIYFNSIDESKTHSIRYLDKQEKSNPLLSTEKKYNQLFVFKNYKFGKNQLEIITSCEENCTAPIIGNAIINYSVKINNQIISIPSNLQDKPENYFSYILNKIKSGEICYSQSGNKLEFWHNPDYTKFNQYYSLINLNENPNFQFSFDLSIIYPNH